MSKTSEKTLRAAVIGAGVFGRFHAAKYDAMDGVDLVGIVDQSPDAAARAAEQFGCASYGGVDELAGRLDMVTVATPAVAHAAAAVTLLEAGAHAYVEKPIAANLPDADRIVAAANANRRVLQVGHQERFVFAHMGLLNRKNRPRLIECHRAGPWTGRGADVNVALDLMVHDIDLVHQIAPGAAKVVTASQRAEAGSYGDEITAELAIASCKALMFASRIAEGRKRYMRLEYDDGAIFIDFMARTIENSTSETLETIFGEAVGGVAADPLGYAVSQFVDCVRTDAQPVITGEDGRRALATTLDILAVAGSPATRDEALAV